VNCDRSKIRGIAALGLLLLPYVLLFAAGSIWLYQYHMLVWWFGVSLATTFFGWQLFKGLRHESIPPLVQPDLRWPPVGTAAWKEVDALAAMIEAEDVPLDQPQRLLDVVRRVVEVVARHYHPQSPAPWLETPMPFFLRIVELAAGDLRRATMSYVPAAHILTVRDWQRLWELAGWANRAYFWYRIVSFFVNTPAALVRESRDVFFGRLKGQSVEALKRWAVGFFVRRAGYYAIQLYGKYLPLDDTEAIDSLHERSRHEAAVDATRRDESQKEPLRLLVVGQVKAGKSSLINALFGEYRAATDVVPRTRYVEPYLLERDGLRQAIILDTAGYDDVEPKQILGELGDHLFHCDIVLVVCAATSAARSPDRAFLDALRTTFQDHRDRHMPVIVAVATKIDQLRPLGQWNPPYCLCPADDAKAENIVAAVEAIGEDLAVDLDNVVPVCLMPERLYNVEEGLIPAILEALPAAERVRYIRCLRQHRDEAYWSLLWRQAVQAGRVLLGGVRRG
jgi:uncharacterized protein